VGREVHGIEWTKETHLQKYSPFEKKNNEIPWSGAATQIRSRSAVIVWLLLKLNTKL
jgi:hypothetical protein